MGDGPAPIDRGWQAITGNRQELGRPGIFRGRGRRSSEQSGVIDDEVASGEPDAGFAEVGDHNPHVRFCEGGAVVRHLTWVRRIRRVSAVTRNPGESAEQHPLLDHLLIIQAFADCRNVIQSRNNSQDR